MNDFNLNERKVGTSPFSINDRLNSRFNVPLPVLDGTLNRINKTFIGGQKLGSKSNLPNSPLKLDDLIIFSPNMKTFLRGKALTKGISISDSNDTLLFLDNTLRTYLKNIIQKLIGIARKRNYTKLFPLKDEGTKLVINTFNPEKEFITPTQVKINYNIYQKFSLYYTLDTNKRIDLINKFEEKKHKKLIKEKEEPNIKNEDDKFIYDYVVYNSSDCTANHKLKEMNKLKFKINLKDLILFLEKNLKYPGYRRNLQTASILYSYCTFNN